MLDEYDFSKLNARLNPYVDRLDEKIIKNAIKCKKCGDIIESKRAHDSVACSCGLCAVDGGHHHLWRSGNSENYEELSIVEKMRVSKGE